jgi:hypothetical protein
VNALGPGRGSDRTNSAEDGPDGRAVWTRIAEAAQELLTPAPDPDETVDRGGVLSRSVRR